ncbi:MAG: hypothetical protein KCHDKBKB_02016 [Elusimicrobia bacterium]|nr:hypothetical protein [Elusimicrobiota bacterium]
MLSGPAMSNPPPKTRFGLLILFSITWGVTPPCPNSWTDPVNTVVPAPNRKGAVPLLLIPVNATAGLSYLPDAMFTMLSPSDAKYRFVMSMIPSCWVMLVRWTHMLPVPVNLPVEVTDKPFPPLKRYRNPDPAPLYVRVPTITRLLSM